MSDYVICEQNGKKVRVPLQGPDYAALLEVAEAAAVLFRPPYRRGNCCIVLPEHQKEHDDWKRLHEALNNPNCPVEIGEELT